MIIICTALLDKTPNVRLPLGVAREDARDVRMVEC